MQHPLKPTIRYNDHRILHPVLSDGRDAVCIRDDDAMHVRDDNALYLCDVDVLYVYVLDYDTRVHGCGWLYHSCFSVKVAGTGEGTIRDVTEGGRELPQELIDEHKEKMKVSSIHV